MDFFTALAERRSIYALSSKSLLSDDELVKLVEYSVKHTPSPFNMQSGRAVLLLHSHHNIFWNMIVMEALRTIAPAGSFKATEDKINMFSNAYGTVLFYDDSSVVADMQSKYASYKDNFPIWATQSMGMLQYSVWLSLSARGMGASLQHYNPLVDKKTAETFAIPDSWMLTAQMPFGNISATAGEKTFIPTADRVKVFK